MASVIWKYPLDLPSVRGHGQGALISVNMPKEAEILSAAFQHSDLCVWVKVNADASPDRPYEDRDILVLGTGMWAPLEGFRFIDTVLTGAFVWHIYEGMPHVQEDR